MKSLIFVLATAAFFSTNAQASLSPYYNSAKKIQVVLASSELANQMHQSSIESISIMDDGLSVLVKSDGCAYSVKLDAHLPVGAGATTYEVNSIVGPMCLGAMQ